MKRWKRIGIFAFSVLIVFCIWLVSSQYRKREPIIRSQEECYSLDVDCIVFTVYNQSKTLIHFSPNGFGCWFEYFVNGAWMRVDSSRTYEEGGSAFIHTAAAQLLQGESHADINVHISPFQGDLAWTPGEYRFVFAYTQGQGSGIYSEPQHLVSNTFKLS